MLTLSGILIQLVGEMRRRWALAFLSSQSIKAENLFWRLKSRPARPRIPEQIQALVRRIANENPWWREQRSRRLIGCNVTAHPSAAWTLQQLREVVGYEERYGFLIHDCDSIFANHLDEWIRRPAPSSFQVPIRAIAAINCLPSAPDRSLAGCPPSAADPRRAPSSSEP